MRKWTARSILRWQVVWHFTEWNNEIFCNSDVRVALNPYKSIRECMALNFLNPGAVNPLIRCFLIQTFLISSSRATWAPADFHLVYHVSCIFIKEIQCKLTSSKYMRWDGIEDNATKDLGGSFSFLHFWLKHLSKAMCLINQKQHALYQFTWLVGRYLSWIKSYCWNQICRLMNHSIFRQYAWLAWVSSVLGMFHLAQVWLM